MNAGSLKTDDWKAMLEQAPWDLLASEYGRRRAGMRAPEDYWLAGMTVGSPTALVMGGGRRKGLDAYFVNVGACIHRHMTRHCMRTGLTVE
jgi:hypothetical protein